MAGAQIRRFLILHKELDADDGELTRTQKVRRGFIAERYAPLIAALYDGSKEADISTEVTFEDGRKGMICARVKIRDCTTEPCRSGEGRMRAPADTNRGRRVLLVGRERLARFRRRESGQRRIVRHPQGRDPRHHRSERRRQNLDAQHHQRLLSSQQGPSHSRARRAHRCGLTRRPPAASRAHFKTLRCSRA